MKNFKSFKTEDLFGATMNSMVTKMSDSALYTLRKKGGGTGVAATRELKKRGKLQNEESDIDELSTGLLKRYTDASMKDQAVRAVKDYKGNEKKITKRIKGMVKAQDKVSARKYQKEEVELIEAKSKAGDVLMNYAKKSGGIDKKDMMNVAGKLQNFTLSGNRGLISDIVKIIKSMDTDPRDKVIEIIMKNDPAMGRSIMRKAGLKLNENANVDYKTSSEKSQFGGFRPKLLNQQGKVSYLGATAYKTAKAAEGEAEAYRDGYFGGPGKANERSAEKAVQAYRKKNAKDLYKKESVDEALEVKLRGGKVPVGQHRFKYDVDKSDKYIENSIKERDPKATVERKGKDLWVTASAQAHSSVIAGMRRFRVNGTISEGYHDAPKGSKVTTKDNPVVVVYDDEAKKGRPGISGNMNLTTFMSIHGISAKFQKELVQLVTKAGKGKKVEVPSNILADYNKEYKKEGKPTRRVWIELNSKMNESLEEDWRQDAKKAPFSGAKKRKANPKDRYGNPIKNRAKHLAKKGMKRFGEMRTENLDKVVNKIMKMKDSPEDIAASLTGIELKDISRNSSEFLKKCKRKDAKAILKNVQDIQG